MIWGMSKHGAIVTHHLSAWEAWGAVKARDEAKGVFYIVAIMSLVGVADGRRAQVIIPNYVNISRQRKPIKDRGF